MPRPETHIDVVREPHGELLREARSGELAKRLGAARREERWSYLSWQALRTTTASAYSKEA